MLRLALILAVLAAVAAYFTKPGPEDVEAELRRALFERIFTTETDAGADILGTAAVVGCRIDPDACFELVRRGLEVTYEDKLLFALVTVEGFGRRAECWGAFTRFSCPGGFEKAEEG